MSEEKALELGLKPLAYFRGFTTMGCEPDEMGIGPVFSVPKLLKNYDYDMVFFFPSWKDIYIKDKNRVEEYEEATRISPYIDKVYEESSILKIKVPCTSINERVDFILNNI